MPKKTRPARAIAKVVKYLADNPAIITALLQVVHAAIWMHVCLADVPPPINPFLSA